MDSAGRGTNFDALLDNSIRGLLRVSEGPFASSRTNYAMAISILKTALRWVKRGRIDIQLWFRRVAGLVDSDPARGRLGSAGNHRHPGADFLISDLVGKSSCPGFAGRLWPVERWIPDLKGA